MSTKTTKPLITAVGAAMLTSAALAPMASAVENPFSATPLTAGYNVADGHAEGKCGEGKCGGGHSKDKEGKCGEGKCGGESKAKEGKCGEGKCGEGKCGAA